MFENDSRIFSIQIPHGCWLWMAVVESSVKFCAVFISNHDHNLFLKVISVGIPYCCSKYWIRVRIS